MRRLTWVTATAMLVLVLTACGSDSDEGGNAAKPEGGGSSTVVLKDIAFKPEQISVKAGDTVTWKFEDKGIAHNVVADDGSFKSENKDSGTFEHTFEKAGSFSYTCTIHPGMKGSVEVT